MPAPLGRRTPLLGRRILLTRKADTPYSEGGYSLFGWRVLLTREAGTGYSLLGSRVLLTTREADTPYSGGGYSLLGRRILLGGPPSRVIWRKHVAGRRACAAAPAPTPNPRPKSWARPAWRRRPLQCVELGDATDTMPLNVSGGLGPERAQTHAHEPGQEQSGQEQSCLSCNGLRYG